MRNIFFDSWESLGRTSIITILAYITMIVMLRVTGKRTLSKMNAFDFIVTIALGSSFASVALNKNVALADGVLVFLLLMLLQFAITWLSARFKAVKKMVTSEPTLLLYKGEIFHNTLKKERITIEEIHVAVRKKGISELKEVAVIILETTGSLTVIQNLEDGRPETLQDVQNFP